MLQCPKHKKIDLMDSVLQDQLSVQCCPDCKGTWIPASEYEAWQSQQAALSPADKESLPKVLDVEFVQSPFDAKAALCPECKCYLSRAKVGMKTPFYVERCLNCGGIWCDYGEWEVLKTMGLHTTIQQLFSSEWQIKLREREYAEQERQATIDKLGEDLANQIFELAALLKAHPNGDFGVAYLMRRFDQR